MTAASISQRSATAGLYGVMWDRQAWALSVDGWVSTKHPCARWWPFMRFTITHEYL